MDALNGLRSDMRELAGVMSRIEALGREVKSAPSDYKDLPNTNRKGAGSVVSESEAFRPRQKVKA